MELAQSSWLPPTDKKYAAKLTHDSKFAVGKFLFRCVVTFVQAQDSTRIWKDLGYG